MVSREKDGLGSMNGSSVEGKDGRGGLRAGEEEGRGFGRGRTGRRWSLLPFGVEVDVWRGRAGQGSRRKLEGLCQAMLLVVEQAGAIVDGLHAKNAAVQQSGRQLQLQPI